jgi:hypothetical protein
MTGTRRFLNSLMKETPGHSVIMIRQSVFFSTTSFASTSFLARSSLYVVKWLIIKEYLSVL